MYYAICNVNGPISVRLGDLRPETFVYSSESEEEQ